MGTAHTNSRADETKKAKTAMAFPQWHIDVTIQLQVLTTRAHKSVIYATTQLAKSTYAQVVPQHVYPKHGRLIITNILEKPRIF